MLQSSRQLIKKAIGLRSFKTTLFCLFGFTTWFTGWPLELMRLSIEFLRWMFKVLEAYKSFWMSFDPDIGFLSDIVAFQGAVIAIAYPLSLEIISRISERYQSNVITKKFNNEWQVKLLPYLLIINVAIAILLSFFSADKLTGAFPKAIAWISMVIFVVSLLLLVGFFATLKNYTANPEYLINELVHDMQRLIRLRPGKRINERVLIKRQNELISAFEGTGDLLSYEVSCKRSDKYLLKTLEEMRLVIKEFLDLKINHPDEFEYLLLPPEFREMYKDRQQDAKLLIHYQPDDYLITFTSAIRQFSRIHEVAISARNLDVGKPALFNFVQLLREMAGQGGNHIFVRQVLSSFSDIQRKAIANEDISSAYTASVSWYTNIVFDIRLRHFNLSYLDLFDEYFFRGVQFLISQGATSTYKGLVSYLVNGIHLKTGNLTTPEDYRDALEEACFENYSNLNDEYNLDARLQALSRIYQEAVSYKDYLNFTEEFDAILSSDRIFKVVQNNTELSKVVQEIKDDLSIIVRKRNLDGLVISFGAYCLFKKRYDYIKYLWEFNQPPDSDAMWLNPSIVPLNLGAVIVQYARRSDFETKVSMFWDDHHGAKVYFDQYFLLLLLRTVRGQNQAREKLRQKIDSFRLPKHIDIHFLHDLQNLQEYYVELAGEIRQDPTLVRELGFDLSQIDLLIDEFLLPFLESLSEKISSHFAELVRIKNIDREKVKEFRQEFVQSFSKNTQLRDIFLQYNLYEDISGKSSDIPGEQLSIGHILDKEAFFEDWYAHFISVGHDFGRDFAISENAHFANALIEWSTRIGVEEFTDILSSLTSQISNIFIVAGNSSLNKFIRKASEFKSKWTHQDLVPMNAINELAGWYSVSDHDVPVYEVYCDVDEKFILVLNKNKLGKLIQHPPQKGWRAKSKADDDSVSGFFYIGITSFSEDQVLMESFLQDPPHWLEEYEGETSQREYLETQVLLEIAEAPELRRADDFEGYVIYLPSEN